MADSKWIDGLTGEMSVVEAACQTLLVRLKAVADRLAPAVYLADQDSEHVHQLRVNTRRAGAALRIFGTLLPEKVFRRVNKKLRTLRRAAGEARDWDVFLETLIERRAAVHSRQKPGLDLLIGVAHGHRLAGQTALTKAAENPKLNVERLIEETLAALCPPNGPAKPGTLRELAGTNLRQLLAELHEAASENLHDYEHLHQVRILGKKLRYAMEIFADCFPATFRDKYYALVEEMQDLLGLANDSHVAGQRLQAIKDRLCAAPSDQWKRYEPGIDGLLMFHDKRLPEQKALFLEWWNNWKKSGKESRLLRLCFGSVESGKPLVR